MIDHSTPRDVDQQGFRPHHGQLLIPDQPHRRVRQRDTQHHVVAFRQQIAQSFRRQRHVRPAIHGRAPPRSHRPHFESPRPRCNGRADPPISDNPDRLTGQLHRLQSTPFPPTHLRPMFLYPFRVPQYMGKDILRNGSPVRSRRIRQHASRCQQIGINREIHPSRSRLKPPRRSTPYHVRQRAHCLRQHVQVFRQKKSVQPRRLSPPLAIRPQDHDLRPGCSRCHAFAPTLNYRLRHTHSKFHHCSIRRLSFIHPFVPEAKGR